MNFEEACAEMEYIINNMDPLERAKIPQKVKNFFTENKDYTYTVNLDYTRNLGEEKLKEETEAFIEIIYNKYLKNKEYNVKENLRNEELPRLIKKETIFTKMLTSIKNIFKRK